ncbi:MAG: hypothetical protein ACREGL_00805 [Alphaproteobacteria bacterium]
MSVAEEKGTGERLRSSEAALRAVLDDVSVAVRAKHRGGRNGVNPAGTRALACGRPDGTKA